MMPLWCVALAEGVEVLAVHHQEGLGSDRRLGPRPLVGRMRMRAIRLSPRHFKCRRQTSGQPWRNRPQSDPLTVPIKYISCLSGYCELKEMKVLDSRFRSRSRIIGPATVLGAGPDCAVLPPAVWRTGTALREITMDGDGCDYGPLEVASHYWPDTYGGIGRSLSGERFMQADRFYQSHITDCDISISTTGWHSMRCAHRHRSGCVATAGASRKGDALVSGDVRVHRAASR